MQVRGTTATSHPSPSIEPSASALSTPDLDRAVCQCGPTPDPGQSPPQYVIHPGSDRAFYQCALYPGPRKEPSVVHAPIQAQDRALFQGHSTPCPGQTCWYDPAHPETCHRTTLQVHCLYDRAQAQHPRIPCFKFPCCECKPGVPLSCPIPGPSTEPSSSTF